MNTSSAAASPDASATPSSGPLAARTPRALLAALQAEFPVFRDALPLAIGIDKALLARLPGLEKKLLRATLSLHTHSTRYLRATEKATHRHDLDGQPAEALREEHRQHAAETLRERRKKQLEARRAEEAAQKASQKAAEAEARRAEKLALLAEKFARK